MDGSLLVAFPDLLLLGTDMCLYFSFALFDLLRLHNMVLCLVVPFLIWAFLNAHLGPL
jgi:hypothetical protein